MIIILRSLMRNLLLICIILLAGPIKAQRLPGKNGTSHPKEGHNMLTINGIHITGNKITRGAIILREIGISEGQSFEADSLKYLVDMTRQRLLNLALFTDINITIDTLNDRETDWNIQVKERWYIWPEISFQLADRNFNVWWKEQHRDIRRTIIGLTLRDRNFRGNLENLSVSAQVGYIRKLYIDYARPYIDKNQQHGVGVSFGISEGNETWYVTDSNKLRFIKTRDSYVSSQMEGAIAYSYRPQYEGKHLIRLSYKQFHISDTVVTLNHDYFDNGSNDLKMLELTYRYELNRTDNWNYPLTGTKLVAQLFTRVGFEGMKFQAFGNVEAGYFINPSDKWYMSGILRGRLSVPEDQPYYLRTALGTKSEYVRGYEYYVIDGSDYGITRVNLKREILNITVRKLPFRYLPVIPIRIYPKLFADGGYVVNKYPGNSFLNNRMLYSAGLGVDIVTAYDLKLRLEYTINHLGQKGLFLHLNSE